MTDEQIRLYALARLAAPTDWRIRTFAEETSGGEILYTVELSRGDKHRWFAIHSLTLRNLIADSLLVAEFRRAFARPPARAPAAG